MADDEAALRIIVRQQRGEIDRIKQELADAKGWAMQERSLRFAAESKPTLTDEERFVLREVRDIYADEDDVKCNEIAAVIDGLLERTK
jgi:hypothetical protein